MVNTPAEVVVSNSSFSGMKITYHNHPLHLSSGDVPGAVHIGIQLVGTENYSLWSRAMRLALLTRNKLGFINGSFLKEDFEANLDMQWERCNVLVVSWITGNGVMFVSAYFSKLKDLWDEYDPIVGPPLCHCDKSKTYILPRSHILMMIPTPTLNQVYAMIIQDESQKHIASGSYGGGDALEPTALFTQGGCGGGHRPPQGYRKGL
ncbi:uncharacterized protein LOC107001547 [Solanum pennellii]|uniref:Uncharacterized protein LOC107001547 n=1 Tax=Solanum pennellii TaxID=28526 RepID=A0ABM1FCQ8_SOLPN|nr:uncharacterized protein LOC107001547 [Solanum pennellii]